jgi:hypothetical protein
MLHAHALLVKEGLDRSVWGKRIIKAELRGNFTQDVEWRADEWMSCACGKLDAHIKRDADYAPTDKKLNKLGIDFSEWIDSDFNTHSFSSSEGVHDQFHGAAITLVAIEKRSIELLSVA